MYFCSWMIFVVSDFSAEYFFALFLPSPSDAWQAVINEDRDLPLHSYFFSRIVEIQVTDFS